MNSTNNRQSISFRLGDEQWAIPRFSPSIGYFFTEPFHIDEHINNEDEACQKRGTQYNECAHADDHRVERVVKTIFIIMIHRLLRHDVFSLPGRSFHHDGHSPIATAALQTLSPAQLQIANPNWLWRKSRLRHYSEWCWGLGGLCHCVSLYIKKVET